MKSTDSAIRKPSASPKWKRTWKRLKADKVLYLMLAPTVLYFMIFRVWPIFNMRLAFFSFRSIGPWEWVGTKYFEMIFSTPVFGQIMTNTLIISFMKYVLLFPFFRYFRTPAQ